MSEQQPATQTMNATDARQQFSRLLNRVFRRETRVLVEKSGIPVAAIISTEDLKRLNRLDELDREAADVLAAMRKPFKDVSPEEIERETDRIVAENRKTRRRKSTTAR